MCKYNIEKLLLPKFFSFFILCSRKNLLRRNNLFSVFSMFLFTFFELQTDYDAIADEKVSLVETTTDKEKFDFHSEKWIFQSDNFQSLATCRVELNLFMSYISLAFF